MQCDKHVNNPLLKCSVQTFDIPYIGLFWRREILADLL